MKVIVAVEKSWNAVEEVVHDQEVRMSADQVESGEMVKRRKKWTAWKFQCTADRTS